MDEELEGDYYTDSKTTGYMKLGWDMDELRDFLSQDEYEKLIEFGNK